MKILLVEDNRVLARSIHKILQHEGFCVEYFFSGSEAEEFWHIHSQDIDLAILDVMLPGKDGIALCESIREKNITTPILMLTSKGEVQDRVTGLQSGADDYLVKPFAFDELLARLQALLRRPKQYENEKLHLGKHIIVDLRARKVEKNGIEIALTPKEFGILAFLIRHKNQALSQQHIFQHVFDFAKDNWSNTIEVHIKNLRKKLFSPPDEKILKTIRGVGYRLEVS